MILSKYQRDYQNIKYDARYICRGAVSRLVREMQSEILSQLQNHKRRPENFSDVQQEGNAYFQVSSRTVFETQLLKDISSNMWVSGATFQSRAKVYNLNFKEKDNSRLRELQEFARSNDEEWELNEQRVNDAWFLWIIVNYYSSKGTLGDTNIQFQYENSGKHLNTEELCKAMWADICVSKNKWVTHACQTPGCAEGYVTIDGNEYLKRSKCALPMEKVKIRRDLPEIYKCCPNSPLPGGKNQKPSKFCADHQSHVETTAEVSVPPEYNTASTEAGLMREDVCLSQQGQTGCKRNCQYHPHLPKFDDIKGVNTESCEQSLRRLNQYFELTRKMTQFKRNVLFWFVNECFNSDLEMELKQKNCCNFKEKRSKSLYLVTVWKM